MYATNPNPNGSPFYRDIRFWTTRWDNALGNYRSGDRMVITPDGMVGIGTGSPTLYANGVGGLGINLSSSGTVGLRMSDASSSTSTEIYTNSTGMVLQQLNGSRHFSFLGGNIGIGTTSPGSLLHTSTTTAADNTGHIMYENTNTGTGNVTNAQIIGKSKYGTLQNMVWESYGARIGMRSTANGGTGHLYFTAGGDSIKMFVDGSTGNVGIGTQSPNQLLTVEGVTSLRETTAPSLSANYGKVYVKSSDSKLYFMDDAGSEFNLLNGGSGSLTGTSSVTNASGNIALNPASSTGSVRITSGTTSSGTRFSCRSCGCRRSRIPRRCRRRGC